MLSFKKSIRIKKICNDKKTLRNLLVFFESCRKIFLKPLINCVLIRRIQR